MAGDEEYMKDGPESPLKRTPLDGSSAPGDPGETPGQDLVLDMGAGDDDPKAAKKAQKGRKPKKRRPFLLRWLLRLPLVVPGLVLLVLAAVAGALGYLQTESGKLLLETKLNEALAPAGVRLANLKGSIPLDFSVDLALVDTGTMAAADADGADSADTSQTAQGAGGEWLSAKGVALALDFGDFPTTLGLSLEVESAHLSHLPQSAPRQETPSDPLDLQALARTMADATGVVPDFVPGVVVKKLSVGRLEVERALYDQAFAEALAENKKTAEQPPAAEIGESGEISAPAKDAAKAPDESRAAPQVDELDAAAVVLALSGQASVLPDAEKGWKDPALSAEITASAFPRPAGLPQGPQGIVELVPRHVFQDVELDLATVHLVLDGSLAAPRAVVEARTNACGAMGYALGKSAVRLVLPEDALGSLAEGKVARLTLLVDTFLDNLPLSLALPLGLGVDGEIATIETAPKILTPGLELSGSLTALLPAELIQGSGFGPSANTPSPGEPAANADASQSPETLAAADASADARTQTAENFLPSLEPLVRSINGGLSLRLGNCPLLARFMGDTSLQGSHALDLAFQKDGDGPQKTELAFRGDGTGIVSGGKSVIALSSVELLAALDSLDFSKAVADISLSAKNARLEGMDPISLSGRIKGPFDAIDVGIETTGGVVSHVQGKVAPLNATASFSRLDVHLPAFGCGIRMDKPVSLAYGPKKSMDHLSLVLQPQGALTLAASLDEQNVAAKGALSRIETEAWSAVVPGLPKGSVDADFDIRGSLALPQGKVNVALRSFELGVEGLPPISADVSAEIAHSGGASQARATVSMHEETRQSLGLETFVCEAAIPLEQKNGQLSLGGNASLKGNVDIRGGLEKLWLLARQPDRRLTGKFAVAADFSGTLSAPAGKARVTVENGLFNDLQYGIQIREIAADLSADFPGNIEGARAEFTIQARDGRRKKGSFEARGQTDLKTVTAEAHLKEFAPVRRRDIRAVLSADCTVTGPLTTPVINGEFRVDRGRIQLDALELPASVTTLELVEGPKEKILADRRAARKRLAEETTAPQGPAGTLNLAFKMEKFFVNGYGFDSEWKADMSMNCPLNAIGVTGQVEAVRGSLDLLNKRFTLQDGTVKFVGGRAPVLHMEMTTNAGEIEAALVVTGTPDKLDLNLQSKPSLPRNDILAYMLFGKPANELSQFELLRLGATAASFAAFGAGGGSGMTSLARHAVGLDVLNLSREKGHTQLEMGRYIMDKVYVGVKQGTDEDSDTTGVIQLELGPRSSATMEAGSGNTAIGWKWKLDY